MSITHELKDALDVASLVRFEDDKLTPADLDWNLIDDVDEALDVWRHAKMQEAAAKQITRVAGQRLAELLGVGGAAGYGDSVIRYKLGWDERCTDPDGFVDYVTMLVKADDVDLGDVFNPNNAKKSWMGLSVRDTFFEKIDNDAPSLTVTPLDRAPKWLQHLNEGEIIVGKVTDDS